MAKPLMQLDTFCNDEFDRGAGRFKELAWLAFHGILFSSWLPGSAWRRSVLRAFGAKIGRGVVIKPNVRVKFPWRLEIGDHVWIGERVWLDNLARITVGSHTCISQGAYLCTGSHDWSDPKFKLITKPIAIGEQCWICARCTLAPGTTVESNVVLTLGTVAKGHLQGDNIYSGTEAVRKRAAFDFIANS